jgi:hypothetical protein
MLHTFYDFNFFYYSRIDSFYVVIGAHDYLQQECTTVCPALAQTLLPLAQDARNLEVSCRLAVAPHIPSFRLCYTVEPGRYPIHPVHRVSVARLRYGQLILDLPKESDWGAAWRASSLQAEDGHRNLVCGLHW